MADRRRIIEKLAQIISQDIVNLIYDSDDHTSTQKFLTDNDKRIPASLKCFFRKSRQKEEETTIENHENKKSQVIANIIISLLVSFIVYRRLLKKLVEKC